MKRVFRSVVGLATVAVAIGFLGSCITTNVLEAAAAAQAEAAAQASSTKVSTSGSAPAPHVKTYAAFNEHRIEFVTIPPAEVEVEALLELRVPGGGQLIAARYPEGGTTGAGVPVEMRGELAIIRFPFPERGTFRLSVAVRLSGSTENRYFGAADITVRSTLPPGVTVLNWRDGGTSTPVFVRDVQELSGQWTYSAGTVAYQRATVERGVTLRAGTRELPVAAGSQIEYQAPGGPNISRVQIRLPQPMVVTAGSEPITLAAGTMFSFQQYDLIGILAAPIERAVLGTMVQFPAGSRVRIEDDRVVHLVPPQRLTVNTAGGIVPCDAWSESVNLKTGQTLHDVFIEQAATITLGGARFELPAFTSIVAEGAKVRFVHAYDDFRVTYRGQTHLVTPEQTARFDEAGVFESVGEGY